MTDLIFLKEFSASTHPRRITKESSKLIELLLSRGREGFGFPSIQSRVELLLLPGAGCFRLCSFHLPKFGLVGPCNGQEDQQ